MNDRPATDLLIARLTEAGIRDTSAASLAGGHWAAQIAARHDVGAPDTDQYLLAVWSDAATGTGEDGATIMVQDPDRDDWDDYTRVLWETRELVSPGVVADLVRMVLDSPNLHWWDSDHHDALAEDLREEAALAHDITE